MRLINAGLAVGMLLLAAIALTIGAYPANAHSWYSNQCCHDRDCRPLPDGAVEATDQGWRLVETGEVVLYGAPEERQSRDGKFHLCRPLASDKWLPPIRCLYVPGFGA